MSLREEFLSVKSTVASSLSMDLVNLVLQWSYWNIDTRSSITVLVRKKQYQKEKEKEKEKAPYINHKRRSEPFRVQGRLRLSRSGPKDVPLSNRKVRTPDVNYAVFCKRNIDCIDVRSILKNNFVHITIRVFLLPFKLSFPIDEKCESRF